MGFSPLVYVVEHPVLDCASFCRCTRFRIVYRCQHRIVIESNLIPTSNTILWKRYTPETRTVVLGRRPDEGGSSPSYEPWPSNHENRTYFDSWPHRSNARWVFSPRFSSCPALLFLHFSQDFGNLILIESLTKSCLQKSGATSLKISLWPISELVRLWADEIKPAITCSFMISSTSI